MKILMYTIIIFLLFSCNNQKESEKENNYQENPETSWNILKVKNDYKALEDFIVDNPETKYLNEAIDLIIELKRQKDDTTSITTYPSYYGRNVIRLLINENNETEIISEIYNSKADSKITEKVLTDFFINLTNHENYPEYISKNIEAINKEISLSKGQCFLIIDGKANIDTIRIIIGSYCNALIKYKQHLSKNYLKIDFKNSNHQTKLILDSLLYNRLLIFSMNQHKRTIHPARR